MADRRSGLTASFLGRPLRHCSAAFRFVFDGIVTIQPFLATGENRIRLR
jgi:hypothetical protein